jgi:hypothetical protein
LPTNSPKGTIIVNDDEGKYPDYLAGSDFDDDTGAPINDLEERVEQLEERTDALTNSLPRLSNSAATGSWALGMAIAVVLSWSRNASILWCILHGIFSWIYVIYFAFTR